MEIKKLGVGFDDKVYGLEFFVMSFVFYIVEGDVVSGIMYNIYKAKIYILVR